jgi:hypothetical protein
MSSAVEEVNVVVSQNDRSVLRDLAKRYRELCESERNEELIEDWRRLNNMKPCRPMIYANDNLLKDEISQQMPTCRVENDLLRGPEWQLSWSLHWSATIHDDRVFDLWLIVPAPRFQHPEGVWGIRPDKVRDGTSRGWRYMPVLKTIEDVRKLKATEHRVLDPNPPLALMLEDISGDILPVHVARHTVYDVWGGTDLCEAAGALFGLQELLQALYTDPEMVHEFMAFTRDAVLANLKQGEAAGDWSTPASFYYITPTHCDDLPDPSPDSHGAKLKDIAWFFHAQEFDGVSPEMFEEFLFDYQLPIMELFGRVAYGCCETLDTKLKVLKRLPNMTKILSGPRSDPACFPEAYGDTCVISWRPLAAIITAGYFNEEAQRTQIREGLAKLEGCNIEIHMHEPMTVHGDLERVRKWVRIVREETAKSTRRNDGR